MSADPTKATIHWPFYPIDKIIGIFSGSATLPAPTLAGNFTTVTQSFPHGFGDSAYFQGIFSADGGTTWGDFGIDIPSLNGIALPTFQTQEATATVDTTNLNVTLTNWFDFTKGTGAIATISFKVYLLAKNTMAVPVQPLVTLSKAQFDSRLNYQKIAFQGTTTVNVGSHTTGSGNVFTHNLGYIPRIRAFMLQAATPTLVEALPQITGTIEARLTTTTLTFFSDQSNSSGINANIEWRIYYEN